MESDPAKLPANVYLALMGRLDCLQRGHMVQVNTYTMHFNRLADFEGAFVAHL